jgi:hypothetical protein
MTVRELKCSYLRYTQGELEELDYEYLTDGLCAVFDCTQIRQFGIQLAWTIRPRWLRKPMYIGVWL